MFLFGSTASIHYTQYSPCCCCSCCCCCCYFGCCLVVLVYCLANQQKRGWLKLWCACSETSLFHLGNMLVAESMQKLHQPWTNSHGHMNQDSMARLFVMSSGLMLHHASWHACIHVLVYGGWGVFSYWFLLVFLVCNILLCWNLALRFAQTKNPCMEGSHPSKPVMQPFLTSTILETLRAWLCGCAMVCRLKIYPGVTSSMILDVLRRFIEKEKCLVQPWGSRIARCFRIMPDLLWGFFPYPKCNIFACHMNLIEYIFLVTK